jgi:polysaccharide export outer membrane protein
MQSRLFRLAAFLLLAAISFSCVPNRRVALLQNRDEYRDPDRYGPGTGMRTYPLPEGYYTLREGDLLDVKISTMTPVAFNPFNDADRSLMPGMLTSQSGNMVQQQGYYVGAKGAVNLPVIGQVAVAGLTVAQAEDSIATAVSEYLEKPVVRLKLINFRFSVIGEVMNESTMLAGDNNLSLIQALAMAGGASEFGDLSRVKIIRQTGAETQVFYTNLLTEEFLTGPGWFVQPNDIIVVSPLKQRAYLKYVSPNLSIFATTVSLLVAVFTLFQLK